MTTYEIINPSDAYTMKSDDFVLACVAVAMLGGGQYGIEGSPILCGWDEFFAKNGIANLSDYVRDNLTRLADVFDTVLIGEPSEREQTEKTLEALQPDKRDKWLADYKNRRRSSMNNIGKSAEEWAKRLRAKHQELSK